MFILLGKSWEYWGMSNLFCLTLFGGLGEYRPVHVRVSFGNAENSGKPRKSQCAKWRCKTKHSAKHRGLRKG